MSAAKKVSCEIVDAETAAGLESLAADLIERNHRHLRDANIKFAWNHSWQEDADGHTTLGQAKKVGDLERDATGIDLYILLNSEFYPEMDEAERVALIDHELCHCEVIYDSNSDPMRDVKDRICYRLRKHDFQEFAAIVRRHGKATPGFVGFSKLAQLQLFPQEASDS